MKLMDKYLNAQRFRQSIITTEDSRNPFENDFTRVIFSSSFRRLQDKTQVFQLDKGDFVRTRLTHSMEVSSLGRSIGLTLENILIKKDLLSEEHRGKISSILASAGLVHDLGNPPFGHFGEEAIQAFFKEYFASHPDIASQLSKTQIADLENFDGNVQTFRVLRKLHFIKDRDGMNMTYAVLATVIKYPFSSIEGNIKSSELSRKKYGFFDSEKEDYLKIRDTFDCKKRYPLTFLLEGADDIAYSVADIEDACKKGIIDSEDIKNYLKKYLVEVMLSDEEREANFIGLFDKLYSEVDEGYKNKLDLAVQQFRIIAQRFMINALIKEYIENINEIISGEYDKDLLENSYASNIREVFNQLGIKIFGHKSIIENEIIGYNVVTYLLKELVPAVISEGHGTNPKNIRYYDLISSNYRFIYENFTDKSIYNRLQLVADYVSGMTDSFALNRYQKFKGFSR